MIQDISPLRLDISWDASAVPDADSTVFCFRGTDVLHRQDKDALFPVFRELSSPGELMYLFSISGRKYFLCTGDGSGMPDGLTYGNIRQLRRQTGASNADILALFTAYHLSCWYTGNRFCGSCGGRMTVRKEERSLICESCGRIVYPRINPAVIIGVIDGDRLLITRYARGYAHDALVAGFVEIGETLEDTVRREVMEEVGLKVKNIRYYGSQPWGATNSLLAGFFCDSDGSPEITLDESELKSAVWTERSAITGQPDDISLTSRMMRAFREQDFPE